MKKAKIFIVEDEPLVADDIALTLEEEGYDVCGIADHYEHAVKEIQKTVPDLVLLDITLSGKKSGIDLAEFISNETKIPFIFLSAHSDSRTLKLAMGSHPSGYLVKPIHKNDLRTTIELTLFKSRQETPAAFNDSFFIREKGNIIRLIPGDIIYVEALDNYCQVFAEKKRFVLSSTLKSLEEKLEPYGFIRIHRSYLVQWNKITSITEQHVMLEAKKIPLGKTYRSDLLKKLNIL